MKYKIINELKVINPEEIESFPAPLFGKGRWREEEDYKNYLESVQPLIEEYEKNGAVHTLQYDRYEDIKRNYAEQSFLNNFKENFLNNIHNIHVTKTITGKYRICDMGYHRLYIAKKYHFKIIVNVVQEEKASTLMEAISNILRI